jgi:hypothetical protein
VSAAKVPPLVATPPLVYVGPGAEPALRGERGILLGSRRPAWVDVVELDRRPGSKLVTLVDLRFAASFPWDVVGLSLPDAELRRREALLLRELVPGDVLVTERGVRFHSGARWVRASLVGVEKKKGRRRRP